MTDSASALARKVLAANQRRPEAVLLLPTGSSAKAIAVAYKKLAVKLHPDKFKSAIAGEVFQRIRWAIMTGSLPIMFGREMRSLACCLHALGTGKCVENDSCACMLRTSHHAETPLKVRIASRHLADLRAVR